MDKNAVFQPIEPMPMSEDDFFRLVKELEDPELRWSAIWKLRASDQHARAHPYFIKIAMNDSLPESDRHDAISSLYEPKSEEAVLALRTLLDLFTDSNDLLFDVITALGLQGDTESGKKIVKYLAPEYKRGLRYTAAEALGRMICFPAIPHLQKILKDPSKVIRQYAIQALVHISQSTGHDPKKYDVVPDLKSLLEDPDDYITEYALKVLYYIEKDR